LSRFSDGTEKGYVLVRTLPYGIVLGYIQTPGYYPTGLTYDGTYFWLADRENDTIYQIELLETEVEPEHSPAPFTLRQNYPNPFNPVTTVSFTLASPSHVTLTVFDSAGRTVATLLDNDMIAGDHTARFVGAGLASGTYFYRLVAGDTVKTGRMTLLK
jgi:hypothetical protein